ncbi:nuclear transport factor 2 family protein [Pseudofrankia asymbiotica]|uniref:Ketosteroid isomerase n=1 Tax=Pseudofrankia asymbiotica TaxID=1834516 RepID=A0A1V2I2I6_9ACTN|nr:nuclear transport factor 2 family protein [Pseudofrankia asymbiotica]ONH22797.1 ketosteroid isomerase [Pseudofrankia asymbiotica]
MITSDAITWTAPNDSHPARIASQRSYSAVAKGDLAEFLTVYAEDAVIEDPVGPSMFDPEGKGHRGHEGILAFWKLVIEPLGRFEFEIYESFANPGSNACANVGRIKTSFPDGSRMTIDLVMVYVVNDDGRVASLKAFWEPGRVMPSFATG